jgi:hypothetical protein
LCSPIVKFLPELHELCPLPLHRVSLSHVCVFGTQEWHQILRKTMTLFSLTIFIEG